MSITSMVICGLTILLSIRSGLRRTGGTIPPLGVGVGGTGRSMIHGPPGGIPGASESIGAAITATTGITVPGMLLTTWGITILTGPTGTDTPTAGHKRDNRSVIGKPIDRRNPDSHPGQRDPEEAAPAAERERRLPGPGIRVQQARALDVATDEVMGAV